MISESARKLTRPSFLLDFNVVNLQLFFTPKKIKIEKFVKMHFI